jgi:Ca2+-binding RTX toxin-like protein
MAVGINPSQALNLGGQPGAYGDTFSALNLFVGADAWIYFPTDGEEVRGGVTLDAKGWPTTFPLVDGFPTTIVANIFYTKVMPAGDYIVEWEGTDMPLSYQSYEMIGPNKYKIRYDGPSAAGEDTGISLRIDPSGPTDTTIDVRNIKIYKAEYADLVAMGESFDPKWFQAIDDFRILRTHDWQGTNFSEVIGPTENDFTADQAFWVKEGRGMPYEKIVEVANDTRSDLWINIPHMATDEYIREVAAYVKANLDPDLRVYVEYTNEYWTTIFDQHPYLTQKGAEMFPGEEFARGQAYAARFSQMTAIFKDVFDADGERLFPTLTLNHAMFGTGEAEAVLNSPAWVAQGGTSPLDAGVKHLATDGYYYWITPDPATEALIASWRPQPDGGFGAARDYLVDRIKTDLVPLWELGRKLADEKGLEFGIYEGGALLINATGFVGGDPIITDFNKRFQLSKEMKQVYEVALQEWQKIGNGTFAWYSDTGRAGDLGDYGLWNAPDYKPEPRTEAIIQANLGTAPWLVNDDRPAATFDNGLYDADVAGTNKMTGTKLDDRLYGLAGNDVINSGDGNDLIVGGIGNDYMIAGNGEDVIYGGVGSDVLRGMDSNDDHFGEAGNDTLIGSPGNDRMDGGADIDTLDYQFSQGVTVDLRTNTVSGGDAQGDVISNFENVSGSMFDDVLNGDATSNVLRGRDGNDTINGGDGNDGIIGGTGVNTLNGDGGDDTFYAGVGIDTFNGGAGALDLVSYITSAAAVTVNLATNQFTGGDAQGDRLIGIERVVGSNFGDTITGDGLANILYGLDGADTLQGGLGNDSLLGGKGADRFRFIEQTSGNATFGRDAIQDYEDSTDRLVISRAIASDVANFLITGNGTNSVMLTIDGQSITLKGALPITITNADIDFV